MGYIGPGAGALVRLLVFALRWIEPIQVGALDWFFCACFAAESTTRAISQDVGGMWRQTTSRRSWVRERRRARRYPQRQLLKGSRR